MYTVESVQYGIVVKGEIPVGDFAALTNAWAERGIDTMAPGIASALGANICVCRKENLEPWRAEVEARAKRLSSGDVELTWLRSPDTGVSSKTIFSVLSEKHGRVAAIRTGVPHDPADFGRCHRLLNLIPGWRERLPEVAAAYPEWSALVREWDTLTKLYEEELPSGSCPKLYAAMQPLIEEGRLADGWKRGE